MGELIYHNDWAASFDKQGAKLLVHKSGVTMHPFEGDNSMDIWNTFHSKDLSATWKERHAKGVPVKLYMTDEDQYKRMAWYDLDTENDDNMHLIDTDDNPYVFAFTAEMDVAAKFCTFHYKQSWLDKKGGERG